MKDSQEYKYLMADRRNNLRVAPDLKQQIFIVDEYPTQIDKLAAWSHMGQVYCQMHSPNKTRLKIDKWRKTIENMP